VGTGVTKSERAREQVCVCVCVFVVVVVVVVVVCGVSARVKNQLVIEVVNKGVQLSAKGDQW
jgi:hypothetical protein